MIYNNIIYIYILSSIIILFIIKYNIFILLILTESIWVCLFCKFLILGLYYDYSTFFLSALLCFLLASVELSIIIFIFYNLKKKF